MNLNELLTGYAIAKLALPAILVIIVLRKLFIWRYGEPEQRSGCGVVVLAIALGLGLLALYIHHSYEATLQREAEVAEASRKLAAQPVEMDHAMSPETTAVLTIPAAAQRRASLEIRWRKARSIAVEKWRADLLTANAIGEIGAVPPMLSVREAGGQVRITNRSLQPVCVSLARVTRPNTDAVERCQVGPAECSMVKPAATLRLPLTRTGAKESCLHAAFEFRVGTVDFPEPSWWSRTAINTFSDPRKDISYKDETDLQSDIARFEATVEDVDRAARWRRDLAP